MNDQPDSDRSSRLHRRHEPDVLAPSFRTRSHAWSPLLRVLNAPLEGLRDAIRAALPGRELAFVEAPVDPSPRRLLVVQGTTSAFRREVDRRLLAG